jgi:hypothetical protein
LKLGVDFATARLDAVCHLQMRVRRGTLLSFGLRVVEVNIQVDDVHVDSPQETQQSRTQ